MAALFAIALGVAAYAGRTWIVGQAIKARLARLGISDVTLTVSEMDQDGLVIDKLAAAHGAVTVSRIKATYTWPDLRNGRVDTLTLSGLSLVAHVDRHEASIGGEKVSDLLGRLTNGGRARLPYDELRIEGGALVVVTPTGSARGTVDLRVAEFNGVWQTAVDLVLKGRNVAAAFHGGGHVNLQAPARSTGDGAFEIAFDRTPVPSFAETASLPAKGVVTAKDGTLTVTTSAPVDAAVSALAPALLAKLPPALTPLFTGRASAAADRLVWRQRLDALKASVTMSGFGFAAGVYGVSGVQAALDISLHPFKVAPPGRITAEAATVGGLKLADLDAEIAGAPGGIDILHAGAGLAGGHIGVQNVSLPDAGAFALDVSKLDLGRLAVLAKVDGLALTGTISGRIPVHRESGVARLDHAALAADGKGVIRYRPKAGAALGSSAGGALALKALSNFHYDALTVALSGGTSGEMVASVGIRGRNPDLYGGYPIALNLNLTGRLAEIIAHGFGAARIPQAAVEQLRRGKAPAGPAPAKAK